MDIDFKNDPQIHLEVYTCMKNQDNSLKRIIMNKTEKHFCLVNKIFQMLETMGRKQNVPYLQKDGTF